SADVGFEGLGLLAPGGFSDASDVSFDGRFVVGTSTSPNGSEAFLWEIGEGMRGLGDLSGGDVRRRALGVSDDGSVVVGYGSTRLNGAIGNEEAFVWTSSTGRMQSLGTRSPTGSSRATCVSGDGRVVAGFD